jgi:glycosyltransferase involved in cell wall biosynthesis
MIFPSKLETWGLPISEFKATGKPIFLSELPYAHETLSEYHSAYFFDPLSPQSLADAMARMIQGENIFQNHHEPSIANPYARNWDELFDLILKD